MPEAAVDEHGDLGLWEDDVGGPADASKGSVTAWNLSPRWWSRERRRTSGCVSLSGSPACSGPAGGCSP